MKRPALYWDMVYSASRRQHHHRCWCCRKIINDGDAVFMWRAGSKATRAMHAECAALPYTPAIHPDSPKTMRDLAARQAEEAFA